LWELQNKNDTASQVGHYFGAGGDFGTNSTGTTTSSVDTTAAVDIVLRGQLADGTDNINLLSYTVELIR